MLRRSFIARYLFVGLAAVVAAVGLRAQAPAKADAEFLRKAYETYRTMRKSSPYAAIPWQYLGPKNISGRATDIAVADRPAAGASTPPTPRAACGRPTTTADLAADLRRHAVHEHRRPRRRAFEPGHRSGSAPARRTSSAPRWPASASTSRPTAARPSRTWVSPTRRRSAASSSTRPIPTSSTSPPPVTSGPTTRMRGVFKTTDGGKTWNKVLYKSPRTGAWDLVMDPANPDVIYASMWQRIRRKWSDPRVEPGYSEGGVFKTTDGGKTWTEANAGLPAPQFRGRIGIDIARSNPKVLYAFVDNYEPARPAKEGERDAYGRSDLRGAHQGGRGLSHRRRRRDVAEGERLERVHDRGTPAPTAGCSGRSASIRPTRTRSTRSALGAQRLDATAARRSRRSPDSRDDPQRPPRPVDRSEEPADDLQRQRRRLLLDRGRRQDLEVRRVGRRRAVLQRRRRPELPAVGLWLDPGHRQPPRPARSQRRAATRSRPWTVEESPGGEGSHHAVDPKNPNIVYSHGFYGNFSRDRPERAGGGARTPRRGGGTGADPQPPPDAPQRTTSIRPKEEGLRAQWMAPVVLSPHDPNTVYLGYQFVFRSTNRGDAWEKISADLTGNDPAQMLPHSSSEIPYQTITALAESPRVKGLIYAGTDDGRLHVTADAGKTWTDFSRACRAASGTRASCRRSTRTTPSTSRSADVKTTTSRRTSTSRPTAARRSPASRQICRPAR